MRKKETAGEAMTFEQALARLERIVEELEGGDASLDDSLRMYEEAVALWRFCEERLRAVEERVRKLGEDNEALTQDDQCAAEDESE